MKRTALTKQAPHPWPFSHGTVVEGPTRLVFLAGQVAFDRHGPDRRLVGVGDPAAQTRQAIENVRTLLRQAGGDLRHVVENHARYGPGFLPGRLDEHDFDVRRRHRHGRAEAARVGVYGRRSFRDESGHADGRA